MMFEPLVGLREVLVTERRTAVDYAEAIQHLVDVRMLSSGGSDRRCIMAMGCSGELILSAASSAQIIVEESLTRGLSACTNHTKVTLTLNADGTLGYSARVSTISGSAVLRKAD